MLLFFGCTDLEPELVGETTGDEFLAEVIRGLEEDPDGTAFTVIGSVYSSLNSFVPQDGIYALLTHTSDEMQGPTRGTDWDDGGVWRVLHTHDWDPFHRMVGAAWGGMNEGIARAYLALQIFEDANAAGNPAVDQAIAEVRFLRAFYMYNLIDLFGQVPALDDSGTPIVLSRSEATDFVISELEDAVRNLADKGGVEYPRVDKGAAYGLLAKMYINRHIYQDRAIDNADMQKVVEAANNLESTGYRIADDYFNIFARDNDSNPDADAEMIVQTQNRDNVGNGPSHSRVMMTLHYNQKMGRPDFEPWNGFTTIADFYNTWDEDGNPSNGVETDDNRFVDDRLFDEAAVNLGFLQGQQFNTAGEPLTNRSGDELLIFTVEVPLNGATERQGVRVLKYWPDLNTNRADLSDTDFALMRFSDIHLLKAEAMWRMGNEAGAILEINDLRLKRGADPILSIDGEGTEILRERGHELYWEGTRRNDLIRFGQFLDTWTNKPNRSDETRLLFPIPQSALDVNPNLMQNPGYN